VDTANKKADGDPNVGPFVNLVVHDVRKPAEIVNYQSMGATPAALAGTLVAGTLIALGLTLGASVRRRRRDLALLRTLGFTRRQLARVVGWQATLAAVLGAAVGTPMGILLGRWSWRLFAHQIFVLERPTVPGWILLVAAGAVVLANLAAALPGAAAARTRADKLLRAT
jgi:ABC-type lipoprotein release transport system permease subunit